MHRSTDLDRLARALALAERTYDKAVTAERVRDYMRLLEDLPIHKVEDAIEQHCAFGKFFPRPADIRKRVTGSENETPTTERQLHCGAPGCPRKAAVFDPSLCHFHAHSPQEEWADVTDGIARGEPKYDLEPHYQARVRLAFLAETGRFEEMESVDGQRGMRWARKQVQLGHIKPNSFKANSQHRKDVLDWLGRAPEAIPEAA